MLTSVFVWQMFNSKLFKFSRPVQYVRLGDLDYKSEDDDARFRQFNIIEGIVHPNYNSPWFYNNIGLLRIDRVDFNQYVQPACLSHWNTVISQKVVATGWGQTSYDSKIESSLQKVQLNLVSFTDCEEIITISRHLPRGLDNQTQLCAGSGIGERDALGVCKHCDTKVTFFSEKVYFLCRDSAVDHFSIQIADYLVCMKSLASHHSGLFLVTQEQEVTLALPHILIGSKALFGGNR